MNEKDPFLTRVINKLYGKQNINKATLNYLLKYVGIDNSNDSFFKQVHLCICNNTFTVNTYILSPSQRFYYYFKAYLIKKYLNTDQIESIGLDYFKFKPNLELKIKKELFPGLENYPLDKIILQIISIVFNPKKMFYVDYNNRLKLFSNDFIELKEDFYFLNTLIKTYVDPKQLFK